MRFAMAFLIALSALTACRRAAIARRGAPNPARSWEAQEASIPSAEDEGKVADLVQRLGDADEKRRKVAVHELEALANAGVSPTQGELLLRAAANEYPPQELAEFSSTQADLIRAAASNPQASYIPIVKAIFPRLHRPASRHGDDPRTEALALLAAIDDQAGALALLDLLEATVSSGGPPPLRLATLERTPKFAAIYFPRILKSASGAAAWGVFSLCLAYAGEGAVTPEQLAPYAGVLVEAYRALGPKLAAAETEPGTAWLWARDYAASREDAALVLDLMGYFPSPDVEAVLHEASMRRDPKLALFGAVSLLRLGHGVDAAVLESVAASAETRSMLLKALERQGRAALFPKEWANEQALAESVMVDWLTFPSELGRAPDAIELMNVVSEDVGPPNGVLDWYLFRFRTLPPHWSDKDGWMAGVAGPFKRAEAPSTRTYGDTFSAFTRWDSRTPAEHVAAVRGLMERWREHKGRIGGP